MVGIVFATRREAEPFLSLAPVEALEARPLPLFQTTADSPVACMAVISGMGKVAATLAATHLVLAHRVSMLINAGLCGRLTMNKRWDIGDLLCISSAVEGDCDRFGKKEPPVACDPGWFRPMTSARLVTSDRPVFDSRWRDHLGAMGELADNEGAAVARVAQRYRIPCAMLKGISDSADETGRQDVARHIDRVSALIADALFDELKIKTTDERP